MGAQSNMNLMFNTRQQQLPNIVDKPVEIKSNFLRKGMGRGGSPTEYDVGFVDAQTGRRVSLNQSMSSIDSPRKVTGGIVPVRRENKTTVRVRTKNNGYVYGNQNMLSTIGSQMGGQDIQMENLLWQKKRAT